MYFKKAKVGDAVHSLVYGEGEINLVSPKEMRVDGFYCIQVTYPKNIVAYTERGVADWNDNDVQTVFYADDVNLEVDDLSQANEDLSLRTIEKNLSSEDLFMQCPSGLWRKVTDCPKSIVLKGIEKHKTFLFKMMKHRRRRRED